MKFIAAAALATVAAAAPEAEPWLGYGLVGAVHPAAIPAVLPGDLSAHASSGELVTLPNGAQVPDTTLSVKAAAADHLAIKSATYAARGLWGGYGLGLWKREAEAEAEPEAWWGGYGLGLGGYAGLGYAGLGYAAYPYAAAVPACINGVAPIGHGLCKRDAEAEPWFGYGAWPYAGAYAWGAPALVAHPNGAVTPPYTPAQQAAAADHFAAKWGKRSADAEAKPWYGLGYAGLGYGGYGYAAAPYAAGYAYWG